MISRLVSKTPDVCIIGSGIIGNAISLSLSRKGYNVHVFDGNPGPGYGTTSYSSGICRMYYSLLDSVKFSWEGYHYWNQWRDYLNYNDKSGYASFNKCGALFLRSENSNKFLDKSIELMNQVGVPLSELTFLETDEIVTDMGLDIYNTYHPRNINQHDFGSTNHTNKITGSAYFPETGYVGNPQMAAMNLYNASKALGTEFHFNTKVKKINVNNESISSIETIDGTIIDTPIVINCGGPHSSQINTMAFNNNNIENDSNIKCRPLRREVAYTSFLKKDYDIDNNGKIIIDLDTGLYFRPEVGNKLLIGSTEPECDKETWEDNIDTMSMNSTELWENQMYRAALRIPELTIPGPRHRQYIVSTYDVSSDWTPIYDKSCINGYYMAMGTSGNQFKNAPVVGDLMSQLVDYCENGIKHDILPMEYKLKKTEGSIDTSIFSRLRESHQNNRNVFG